VLCFQRVGARSSVDRASGSGPEGRGFESLRARFSTVDERSVNQLTIPERGKIALPADSPYRAANSPSLRHYLQTLWRGCFYKDKLL